MAIIERIDTNGKRRWQVRIAIRDADGKRQNRTIGTFATKKEAKRAEREVLSARDRGAVIGPDRLTVAELVDGWLTLKAAAISKNSARDYEGAARIHIKPAVGSVRVQRLSGETLQAAYTSWREAGLSPAMIRKCHVVVSQALDLAVRRGVVPRNVAADIILPRLDKPKANLWTADQLRRFLDAAQARPVLHRGGDSGVRRPDDMVALWFLLGLEGVRRGEGLGLRWSDVDFGKGTAHLVQTVAPDKSNRGAAVILERTKTAASSRTVRLTSETLAVLVAHRDRQRFQRQQAGTAWRDLDLITTTADGGPVNPSNVSRSFDRLAAQAGLPRITPHGLRHSCASLLMQAGVPVKAISERLGYSSVNITLNVYSHLVEDTQRDAALAMSALIARSKTAVSS